jgi:hypothetical protein
MRSNIQQDREANSQQVYIVIAGIFITIGLVITALLFIHEPPNYNHIGRHLRQQESQNNTLQNYYSRNGSIGDFLGGTVGTLFSLAGFILIYLSFKSQQQALKSQKEDFENEKIESRFFELIRLHRENVGELVFRHPYDGSEISVGRNVFKDIYSQLDFAIKHTTRIVNLLSIQSIVKNDSIINSFSKEDHIKKEFAISSLSYSIVFFGVATESYEGIRNVLNKDFEQSFIETFIRFFALIPVKQSKLHQEWAKYIKGSSFNKELTDHFTHNIPISISNITKLNFNGGYGKFFGGHQSKLGHYYRHLFRTVDYIDSKQLRHDEKDEYIRILRAQLSNYEEFLLFFNSISFGGREWELKHLNNANKRLISKYNLIRNIPYTKYKYKVDQIDYQIDLKSFYPLVSYEFEIVPPEREAFIQSVREIDFQTD